MREVLCQLALVMDNCISIYTQRHFIRMRSLEGESLSAVNSLEKEIEKKRKMLRGWKFKNYWHF